MLRVDQAGEYGATRIYAGQLAVMGTRAPHAGEVAAMAAQESAHRERFDALMAERGTRPTALQPIWSAAGFALGAAGNAESALVVDGLTVASGRTRRAAPRTAA